MPTKHESVRSQLLVTQRTSTVLWQWAANKIHEIGVFRQLRHLRLSDSRSMMSGLFTSASLENLACWNASYYLLPNDASKSWTGFRALKGHIHAGRLISTCSIDTCYLVALLNPDPRGNSESAVVIFTPTLSVQSLIYQVALSFLLSPYVRIPNSWKAEKKDRISE